MNIIGVFRSFFDGFGGFLKFMNTEFSLGTLTFTPLTFFGVSIGVFLTTALALHLYHLLKPIG